MSDLPENTWSDGEGPQCPFCETVFTADDPMYFDEAGFEDECGNCGGTIHVQPHISVSWNTAAVRRNAPLSPL